MSLKLYNTLGNKKEEFVPIHEGKAGVYGCGPTVYDYAHIGNLRTYIFQDILVKTLRFLGYDVTHVMNITDVGHLTDDEDSGEDKMLKSAEERGKSVLEIAEFYTKAFFNDTEILMTLFFGLQKASLKIMPSFGIRLGDEAIPAGISSALP